MNVSSEGIFLLRVHIYPRNICIFVIFRKVSSESIFHKDTHIPEKYLYFQNCHECILRRYFFKGTYKSEKYIYILPNLMKVSLISWKYLPKYFHTDTHMPEKYVYFLLRRYCIIYIYIYIYIYICVCVCVCVCV